MSGPHPSELHSSTQPQIPSPASTLRLLWLDPSSPPVSRLMRRMLERRGIRVEAPPSIAAALDWLETWPFDLLVADETIFAEDYPGRPDRLFIQMMKFQRDLPLALTGCSNPVAAVTSEFSRATPVFTLRKPVDLTELLNGVRGCFGEQEIPAARLPGYGRELPDASDDLAGLRVLVADNRFPMTALFVKKMIKRCGGGGQVELAETVERASELLKDNEFDLVVMDTSLATGEDTGLMRALSEMPGAPHFCLTGGSLPPREILTAPPLNRAVCALTKPFDLSDLFDVLAACRPDFRSSA